jgi:hypothetical protein
MKSLKMAALFKRAAIFLQIAGTFWRFWLSITIMAYFGGGFYRKFTVFLLPFAADLYIM